MKSYVKEVVIGICVIVGIIITYHISNKEDERQEILNIAVEEKLTGMDIYSFGEVFRFYLNQKGEGWIFTWRGNKYITLLKEGK